MKRHEKWIFASAFAGALQEQRKKPFEGDSEDDPMGYDAWLARTAVEAARIASEAAGALRTADIAIGLLEAVAEDTTQPERAAAAHEKWVELDTVHHSIQEYCSAFEDEDEDYEDCEDDEDDDEDEERGQLSLEEQAIVAEVERTVGVPLHFERVVGPPGHRCECETCERPCDHREEMLQAVAMLNKVRSGQHDA